MWIFRHYLPARSQKDTMMDTTTIAPRAPTTTAFPVAAVETCLRGELIDTIKAEAEIRGETLPDTPAALAKAAVSMIPWWWFPFFARSSRSSGSSCRKAWCAPAAIVRWRARSGICCHGSKSSG